MLNNKKMIEKPWGSEVIWAETEDYVGKIIFINKDHRLSRQYHEKKEETILVKRGSLTLEIGSIDSGGMNTPWHHTQVLCCQGPCGANRS